MLKVKRSNKLTVTCSLEESTVKLVDLYAAYLDVTGDEIINSALDEVFKRDKDFKQYREQNNDAQAPSSLRLKKPATPAVAPKKAPRKPQLAIAQ